MVTRSGVTTIEKCTSFKMLDVSIVFLQTSKITQRDEYVLLSPFPDTFPQNFPIQRPSNTYIYIYNTRTYIYIYKYIYISVRLVHLLMDVPPTGSKGFREVAGRDVGRLSSWCSGES